MQEPYTLNKMLGLEVILGALLNADLSVESLEGTASNKRSDLIAQNFSLEILLSKALQPSFSLRVYLCS